MGYPESAGKPYAKRKRNGDDAQKRKQNVTLGPKAELPSFIIVATRGNFVKNQFGAQ
jgi:hypothetical protein